MPVRTLGVEEELHLVDSETSQLAPRAPQVLGALPDEGFAAELQRSTVETNTDVCLSLDELQQALCDRRARVIKASQDLGLEVFAAGTAPLQGTTGFELTTGGRFSRMQQDYRILLDEHLVCGVQVHIGVDDPDLAVRILPRVEPVLPILLALSVSSPFWGDRDSGYASMRTTLWQRWPTAGRAPIVASRAEYDRVVATLISNGTITDSKMAYFDVRPSPHLPTVELRVCDACPLVDDVMLIAALFRAAVDQAVAADLAKGTPARIPGSFYRAAMWRAARSGLSGELLDQMTDSVPAAAAVSLLAQRLRPQLEDAGDWEAVSELASAAIARGSSSERQRTRYAERGRLSDVVSLLVEETKGQGWSANLATRWTAGYRSTATDEALRPSGIPVPVYEPIFAALREFKPRELFRRAHEVRTEASRQDLTFGVEGQQRPFPVDGFPRVISAHEWQVLSEGLTQRARALEEYLRDAYGAARIVRDGVIQAETLLQNSGWRPEARLLPQGVMRAPVMGFDLVRDDDVGGWRVLEDNVRVPSGVGYAIALRRVTLRAVPELARDIALRNPDDVPALVGRTLRACARVPDPVVALLSEGADNSGWFEHRLLAEEAGLLLAQPDDVDVRGGRVWVGDQPVDVVYLRLESELIDLAAQSGRGIGAEIFDVAREGGVVAVNAPGNGIADDKAAYCHVPDLITYYLQERPLIAQVPTYRCADASERLLVLDRLDQLVTKPVGGYGGSGVLIGPDATPEELRRRQQEILAEPAAWVAQETVSLSTVPTLVGDSLEARHVDLRAFVYLTGTGPGDAQLADLALTRVAPEGTMVVNSSRGGGAKDTWILADPTHAAHAAGRAEYNRSMD